MSRLAARRIGAYVVDICALFSILALAGFLFQKLLGVSPQTGPQVWLTIVWNFSLPCWLYFILSDRSESGVTLGKRVFHLRVTDTASEQISGARAFGRTAIKLAPWEMVHVSAFALSEDLSQLSTVQKLGLGLANTLIVVYLVVTLLTNGRKSIHDFTARTAVGWRG